MSSKLKGKNLIFLISMPRSGSTLLQLMLAKHKKILTTSETWLMLHPLYALKDSGYQAEYNAQLAKKAKEEFFQEFKTTKNTYINGIRRMFSYLYGEKIKGSKSKYFLDKTPRYYYIITELYRTFPEAKYIILFRNPLAICSSILNTWLKNDWFRLYQFRGDLLEAPFLLLKGEKMLGRKAIVINYENLVEKPELQIKNLCQKLKINFQKKMIFYGEKKLLNFRFGDQGNINKHSGPVKDYAYSWIKNLYNPQIWLLLNDYLSFLGEDTCKKMGYSFKNMRQILEKHRPNILDRSLRFNLFWLLKKSKKERSSLEEEFLKSTIYLQKKIELIRIIKETKDPMTVKIRKIFNHLKTKKLLKALFYFFYLRLVGFQK